VVVVGRSIKAFVHKDEKYYVAECLEIPVVTQGETLDETMSNLQEAVALHLEGEDLADFDLAPKPSLLVTFELEPVVIP
jgi:predicted RNase H-like HicB family nuclease